MNLKKFEEKYMEVQSLQGQNGNFNFDRYMLGLYNGMEMIISMYENREPNYKDANEVKFLNDKQDILQQRNAKAIEMIGLIIRDIEENNVPPKMQDLYEILSILQGEEVKDNEI